MPNTDTLLLSIDTMLTNDIKSFSFLVPQLKRMSPLEVSGTLEYYKIRMMYLFQELQEYFDLFSYEELDKIQKMFDRSMKCYLMFATLGISSI